MDASLMIKMLFWSGISHFVLSIASLTIPRILHWNSNLRQLTPLFRQMFWVYAAYILAINMAFGVISVFGGSELLNGSFLAKAVTLFIAIYWLGRIVVQFFYFDRSVAPKGVVFSAGEIALVATFIFFSVVYLLAFLLNNGWI